MPRQGTLFLCLALPFASSLKLNGVASSRRSVVAAAASSTMLAAWPAHAKKKVAEAPKCYDNRFVEVPCQSELQATDAESSDSKTANELDINNFIAADFKIFPGLYPTIAGKLLNARTRQRTTGEFQSKQAMYDSLESDAEVAALKRYDRNIVIRPVDAKLMQFKVATGSVGSQGGG